MSAVLAVRDLSVSAADGTQLLANIDLEVASGEHVLIIGASGSGKSTLMRVVAGLSLRPGVQVSGSVTVAGAPALDPEHGPLDIGWLPQHPTAAVCLPVVEDDVAFGCENRGQPVARIEQAVSAALGAVGAIELRSRDSATLSSGQAQRVGLASATAHRPALLLLDEPISMLDSSALAKVRDAVGNLRGREAAPAVLLVEHRLDEWATDADLPSRVVVLDGGRIVADGPAPRVWAHWAGRLRDAGCHLPWQVEQALPRRAPIQRTAVAPGEVLLAASGLEVGRADALLREVDLRVRAGEVIALVGANGSGKSSLLLTLAGLLAPRAGRVDAPGGRPALVFSDPELQFLALTVEQELSHDGALAADVATMLTDLRLAHAAQRSVHRLSGGEQRRLSVGAVLLGGRRVVLADEPTFGLDRAAVRWTVGALRAAAAEGRGVVVASHDLRFVAEVADVVFVLRGGRLEGGGPPAAELSQTGLAAAGLSPATAVQAMAASA